MDHDQIDALAHKAGCLPEAVQDIRSRVLARFAGEAPEPATVEAWLTTQLKPAAVHLFSPVQTLWGRLGMSQEQFTAMPPSWRLAQAREHQPPVTRAHPRRPQPREVPAALQEQWQDLPPAQRLTRFREWRDSQG
jgi:hypothetical protein